MVIRGTVRQALPLGISFPVEPGLRSVPEATSRSRAGPATNRARVHHRMRAPRPRRILVGVG